MNIKKKILIIVLGVLFTPSLLSAQHKNQIAIQTGTFHYFFEGSPILNVNYRDEDRRAFNGLLFDSQGIVYSRNLRKELDISLEANYFLVNYNKFSINNFLLQNQQLSYKEPVVRARYWTTFSLVLSNKRALMQKISFLYGGGLNFQIGREVLIVGFGQLGPGFYEGSYEYVRRRDLGLNAFAGIEYDITNWLHVYSKINFLGFVYQHDKKTKKQLIEVNESPQFPSRFDLSLNFGLGYSF